MVWWDMVHERDYGSSCVGMNIGLGLGLGFVFLL